MEFQKEIVLRDAVEINASPETVWNFFEKIEDNYKLWHPEEHISVKWIKGPSHEMGSIIYAKEFLYGKEHKIKMKVVAVEKHRRIEYRSFFPLSMFYPRSQYLFEPKENGCVFTAVNYFRFPKFIYAIARRRIDASIAATKKHIREEGVNLKRLLERSMT